MLRTGGDEIHRIRRPPGLDASAGETLPEPVGQVLDECIPLRAREVLVDDERVTAPIGFVDLAPVEILRRPPVP